MKLTVLLFAFVFTSLHPFYLGVTDLRYHASSRALQCSVKLFTNDLEEALKRLHHRPVDLINYKDTTAVAQLLAAYVRKRFELRLNGKVRSFTWVGFEREEEATWVYLEYRNCETPAALQVKNTLLYDFLGNQAHILQVEVNGRRQSAKINNPDSSFVFTFP